jgi:predicted ATPase
MELSLVTSRLTGARPSDGDWRAVTTRVAGLYGANASGKSTILDALHFMTQAVRFSATRWGAEEEFPYRPFSLDDESAASPSSYEVDFVLSGVRYSYGFESMTTGIQGEWLYSYPTGRKRTLFERTGPAGDDIEFGRTLSGENVRIARLLRPTSLYLSTAANSNHEFLGSIHAWLTHCIRYAEYSDRDRQARMRFVRRAVQDDAVLAQAIGLLRFADLGITGLVVGEETLSDAREAELSRILEALVEPGEQRMRVVDRDAFLDEFKKKILFAHAGRDPGRTYMLPLDSESSGTIAWLSLAVPALSTLRSGGVLAVDELDASLHPRLAAALIAMFKDEEVNLTGGQLIFTSHETSLLGSLPGAGLAKDEIWFVEKTGEGATEVFALTEFPVRATDNYERRYLQGRYGAVPIVSPEELRAVVSQEVE